MPRRRPKALDAAVLMLAAVCAVLAVTWGPGLLPPRPGASPAPSPSAATPAPAPPAATGSARALVDTLRVRPDAAAVGGYDPDAFGWRTDTDRNGCDSRNDVLRRDLEAVQIKPGTHGCKVVSGVLTSPYSGARIEFVAGSSSGVDIDHIVAREDAWQSGASTWDESELVAFGNDPLNLLAVEASLNRSHGSRTADEWVPDGPGAACSYVSRQVAVKARYHLTVTAAEKETFVRILDSCPNNGTLPDHVEWPAPGGE